MSDSFGQAALALYAVAARILGWKPEEFWAATPAELLAALAPPGGASTLGRADLERMMEHDNG